MRSFGVQHSHRTARLDIRPPAIMEASVHESPLMYPTFTRVVLTLAIVPSLAFAQRVATSSDSTAIPRELALALISSGPGMSPNALLVGKAPDDIPPDLIPPGTEILGSVTQFDQRIIVLAMKQSPDSAIGAMEARLVAAGWKEPPAAPQVSRAGFVGADAFSSIGGRPDVVCREDEVVMLSSMYRRSGGSILKVSYSKGQRYNSCNVRREAYRSPYDDAPVPTLRAPVGSISRGNGMGGSSDGEVNLTTKLGTRLKPAEVVAHYDKQMVSAGWTSVSEGSVDIVAVHTYRKADEKGQAWTATLVSQTVPDGSDQDVSLRLNRRKQ